MPHATSMGKRQSVIERYKAGDKKSSICTDLGLSSATVWALCKSYDQWGVEGLRTHYDRSGPQGPKYDVFIYRAVRCLKTWHPGWGGGRIQALLEKKYPHLLLPNVRTIQRWFVNNGQVKPKSKPPSIQDTRWAKQVHEVWQVDAKEQLTLGDETRASWLNIKDEYSSGAIDAPVFFPRED